MIYKIILKNGAEYVLEDYQHVKYYWYQWRKHADRVEVIDPPKPQKRKAPEGF